MDPTDNRVTPEIPASRYLAEALRSAGISHYFHVPVSVPDALKEMVKLGMTPVMTHGEKAAAYMADGYARVSGRPGACGSQTIGATNLAAGLRDAYMARIPVVAFTGGTRPDWQYRGQYQEIDDMPVYEAVTKFNATVWGADRLPDLLTSAFRAATTGAPQPVHLELSGISGEVALAGTVNADPARLSRYGQYPAVRPAPSEEDVASAVQALASAVRPVMVVGGGARSSGARAEVEALARALQMPVALALNARGAFPEDDPLYLGVAGEYSAESANKAVCEADLVLERVAEVEESDRVPMLPQRLCRELSEALPTDAILVSDTGHAGAWLAQNLQARHPQQTIIRAHGSLGWAFPAAIGAKCAAPDRPVVCFTGDGGFYYHLAELETTVRYGINIVVVVNNNSSYNQEQPIWEGNEQYDNLWKLTPTDFVGVAEAFGCMGRRVEKPAELGEALAWAVSARRPVVLDVPTEITALSIPSFDPAGSSGMYDL